MARLAAAAALAVVLAPSWSYAQTPQFTVTVASATVHKSPTTASAVVGRAPRGSVLEVSRDIGSWVKIAWPDAEDGVGYVHQSMGRMTQRATREERIATALAPPPPSAAPMASSAMAAPSGESTQSTAATQIRMTYVPTPTHVFGLGARTGGTHEFGVTTRLWSRQRFGVQVEATRASETSDEAPGRVTSLEFAPGVIYMLRDHVTDSVWVRPYVGADVPIRRATFRLVSDDPTPVTDNSIGLRAFGGAELTFPGVPRLAVSADVGYLKADAPFPGFDAGGVRVSIAAHWYVK